MNAAVMSLTFATSAQYTKTPFYSHCIGFSCMVTQLVEDTIILQCSVNILLDKACF